MRAGDQAWFQIGALVVTLLISLGGGLITGFVIKLPQLQFTGKLKVLCLVFEFLLFEFSDLLI